MTRRHAVAGMLVTPLFAGDRGTGAPAANSADQTTKLAPREGKDLYTLNVVLHGMFVLTVPDQHTAAPSDGIEILIPGQMDHTRKWGLWCSEVDLPSQTQPLEIAGITGGLPLGVEDLNPDMNLVMRGVSVTRAGSALLGLFCSIKLPFPQKIYSMRKVCKKPHLDDFITGDAAYYLWRAPQMISMVHVLQYTFSDPAKVSFGGNKLNVSTGQKIVNLHIWSDPRVRHEVSPPKMVDLASMKDQLGEMNLSTWYWVKQTTPFESMVKSFTGLDCHQTDVYRDRSGALDQREVIAGLAHYEKYSLSELGNSCKNPPAIEHGCDYEEPFHTKRTIVTCMALFVYGTGT